MTAASRIRKQMIEQLRTNGTLSTSPRPNSAITEEQAQDPFIKTIARTIASSATHKTERWLARAVHHSVLP